MRIIVMFDLPTETLLQKKEYRNFRKKLIKSGFIMLQESVYVKLSLNNSSTNLIIKNIKKNPPANGLIQILVVTEKQFSKMEFIVGNSNSEYIDTDERFIEL